MDLQLHLTIVKTNGEELTLKTGNANHAKTWLSQFALETSGVTMLATAEGYAEADALLDVISAPAAP